MSIFSRSVDIYPKSVFNYLMSGRLAEVDEEALAPEEEEASTMTQGVAVTEDSGTPAEDMRRLSLLWKVKMTQIQMMQDRNYEITPLDRELIDEALSPALFWEFIQTKIPDMIKASSSQPASAAATTALWDLLSETYISKKDPQCHNLVVFLPRPLTRAFPTVKLNKIIAQVKKDPTIRCLDVIYEFQIAKPQRTKLAGLNRTVAEWSWPELVMPITRSVYVGNSFRVLTPDEFSKSYSRDPIAARAGLPALCRDDPLVRYFQWSVDMIIRSIEIGDVNVAVTRVMKDYIVTGNTIFANIDTVEQQPSASTVA